MGSAKKGHWQHQLGLGARPGSPRIRGPDPSQTINVVKAALATSWLEEAAMLTGPGTPQGHPTCAGRRDIHRPVLLGSIETL